MPNAYRLFYKFIICISLFDKNPFIFLFYIPSVFNLIDMECKCRVGRVCYCLTYLKLGFRLFLQGVNNFTSINRWNHWSIDFIRMIFLIKIQQNICYFILFLFVYHTSFPFCSLFCSNLYVIVHLPVLKSYFEYSSIIFTHPLSEKRNNPFGVIMQVPTRYLPRKFFRSPLNTMITPSSLILFLSVLIQKSFRHILFDQ